MKIFSYIRTPSNTSESNRNAAKYKMLVALGLLVAGAFFLFAGIPAAHADRGPCSFLGATFTIQYYQTSGTSTPWTNYVADGTGMCTVPNNLSPVVSPGGTIYVLVTVTGGPASTELWYTLDNQAIQLVCTTDASGACSGEIVVVVSPDLVASGQCATVQEKVLFSNTTPTHDSFDGNIIDHIVTGSGCSGVTGTSSISTTVVDETNPASFPPGKAGDSFHDTATLVVFGDSASNPTGTVTYQFFTTGDCSGPSTTSTGTVGGTAASPTVGPSASTGPLQPGSYSFQATYSGDSHYAGSTSSCEPFTVVAFANPPTVSKTATGTYTTTYKWTITKSVDNTLVDTAGGSPATFAYTVTVTPDSGTISAIAVSGTITVTNTNNLPMTVTVTDVLNDGTVCSVTGGSGATISAMSSQSFDYTCSDSNTSLPSSNTATVAWSSGGMSDTTASPPVTISFTQNLVDDTVSVTDTVAGPLGTCSAISNPTGCTFTYSKTYTDPAGTCTSHPNTATFTTNTTGKTGSASQSVTDCQGANLTVTKTATTSFTRTFTWAITKSVDNTIVHTAGGAPATFNYDVSVAHDAGTDSGWTVSGTITVANPNNWEAITATVTDAIPGGSCTVTGGTSVSIPASSSMSFPYSCSFSSNPGSGTNTATATWDAVAASTTSGSATGTASFAFGSPTTIINGCVAVSDTLGGSLGTVCYTDPSPTDFTYSSIVNGPAGTCTTQSNTATFTTDTNGITGSASQTVKDCQGADLTLTKTATASFTRTFTWTITKSVDNTLIHTAGGSPAIFNYVVSVSHDSGTDSGWTVSGTITVTNPNDWEVITTTVTDSVPGGTCSVTGGTVTIPASGSVTLTYACSFASNPGSGTNTATATWDATAASTPDASASGTAPFAFGAPTTIVDGIVSVSDTLGGFLGTVSYTDPSPTTFTYSNTINGPAGTCTTQSNTATFTTDTNGITGSASQTVKDCQGADLTLTKTATPSNNWSISKSEDQTQIDIASGGTATFHYTIVVDSSGWQVTGTITVSNPNDWEAITTTVTDAVNNGGSCTVAGGSSVIVPASGSISLSYTCTYSTYPTSASGTNTATATWDNTLFSTPDGSATGTASFAFPPVTATDTLPGGSAIGLGTCDVTAKCTFTISFTTTGVAGTCTSYTDTAILSTGQSDSKTGKVCVGIDLTVSKTATPTSTWSISKTIDKTSVTIPQGGTATFTYTIVVTNTGNTVSGTITITNPNDWEAITANVADAVNNGGSCTVASMTVTVPASASVTDAYTCTYSGSPSSSSGMNTATVTWDQTAFHTPDGVATGTASFAFSPVTVTDTLPDGSVTNLGTCSVTSSPCTFHDTFTTSGVNGSCTAYTNTAKIVETGQTASATATVCVTPPGGVTDTAFCPIPATGFNLVLIQNTTSSYQLRATNPGQFYYNAFYISSSSTPSSTVFTATIPFPFITQGANPIQVFENQPLPTCGSTVPSTNINSQFTISPTSITLSSYSVQNFGSTVTVTFTLNTAIPAGNLLWFAIHLNYGLKGFNYSKGTQTCPTATAVTGPSVTIPCGQSYTFSNSISGSTTVTSTNNFNKDPGFAGVILDQNQNPIPGVTVKIYDNNMNLIGITTTDQNGVYLFQYKYTGQKTTFTIVAILPASISNNYTTASATQTVTMQSNQLVETNFTFTHK